ncbi:MAG: DUF6599 family protein [Bacteroidota bacterium]|nr:DUF6599 family protein [Bacteroidota bacterium]
MKFLFSIFYLFQIFFLGFAQQEMPKITAKDMKGLEILNSREFTGNALWGYINGGADLYLEYGFDFLRVDDLRVDNLRVENLKLKEQEFIVNIYKMKDAAAAFGIYSVSWFNCAGILPEHNISCLTPYQLQFVKGQYYISIINETGNAEARKIDLKLARIISAKIEGNDFEVPEVFQKKELEGIHGQAKLMKGRLGLENGFPAWSGYFENIENFQVYMFVLKESESKIYIAEFILEDKTLVEQLYKNIGLEFNNPVKGIETFSVDGERCLLPVSGKSFVFFESTDAPEQISNYLQLFIMQ